MSTESDTTRRLLARIALGLDAEALLQSNIGRALQNRAAEEIVVALDELRTVDAANPKAILELQNRIHVAETALQWINDIVAEGATAQQQLDNEN